MTAITRLAMAKALLDSRLKIESITDKLSPKIYVHKLKIVALRERLLGRSSGGISNLNVFVPEMATADLIEYMGTLADASPIEKAIASQYLNQIDIQLQTSSANQGLERSHEVSDLRRELGLDATDGDYTVNVEVLNSFTLKGRDDAYELSEAVEERDKVMRALNERMKVVNAQYTANRVEIRKKTYALRELADSKLTEFISEMYAKGMSYVELRKNDEYLRLKAVVEKEQYRVDDIVRNNGVLGEMRNFMPDDESLKELEEEYNEVGKRNANHGKALINKVIALSPITEKAAQEWANNVPIEKAAKSKLEKMGYPVKQVQADMAEFYRLTHGRLGNVSFSATRERRSSASGTVNMVAGGVSVASGFNKETLFHELGHHLEADPAARMASNGFLLSRRTSERARSLRSITQSKVYGSDEIAYEDHFISPYVGKFYEDGCTEVFSMGIESFSNPELLARRAAKDPQHIALILGFIRSDIHPAFHAVRSIYESKANAQNDYKETQAATQDELIAEIAKTVTIDQTEPEPTSLADDPWRRKMFRLKKYIGKINDYYAYASMSKNHLTKRLVADTSLIAIHGNGQFTHYLIGSTDLNRAKALAAILKAGLGNNFEIKTLQKLTEIIQNDTP